MTGLSAGTLWSETQNPWIHPGRISVSHSAPGPTGEPGPADRSGGPSDERLLSESRAGSAVAMGALLERHLPGLRAFVRLRMGPALRAQESESDLVQSVCLELIEDLSDFEYRGEGQFRRWLYTAALNKIHKHHRHYTAKKRGGGVGHVGLPGEARFDDTRANEARFDEALWHNSYQALCSPSQLCLVRCR